MFFLSIPSDTCTLHSKHTLNPDATTTTPQAALTVRSVSLSYTTGASRIVVLSDINANWMCNSVTLLLGSDGADWTTLMKVSRMLYVWCTLYVF